MTLTFLSNDKLFCLTTSWNPFRSEAFPSFAMHVPGDSAAQLLGADFFAAGAPGEVRLVLARGHNRIIEWVLVAMRRIRVIGVQNVGAADKVVRGVAREAMRCDCH